MEIGKTVYFSNRAEWRKWLSKHHESEREIWLIYYRKDSGKARIPYNDAVEEALCFGWIDSILKKVDAESFAQRFSPRNPKSRWSEMNKERVRRLVEQGKMTEAGLAKLGGGVDDLPYEIPDDILEALKANEETWENFQRFPESYKRIRVGWIDGSRNNPEAFSTRLRYFLKMTKQNKRFGMVH